MPGKDEARLLPKGAHWALAVLTALNIINVWHRYLIYNLSAVSVEDCPVCDDVSFIPLCFIDEITSSDSEESCLSCRNSYNTGFYNLKDGACIDNTQYGILAGVGFTLMFAIATLFAGRLTDTLDRRLLHTGAILVWSLSASAHGMCSSFSCLLVFRVLLGIGEAFNAPACYALIALYFPHFKRATANGIYSTGTYLGSAMSSLCLAIAVSMGWRSTAFLSGAFGVLAGAILFFTVEHNPVIPPSTIGYTKLPDDSPESTATLLTESTTSTSMTSPSGYQVPSVLRRKSLCNGGGAAANVGGGGGLPTPIITSNKHSYVANAPGGGALAGVVGSDVRTGGDPSLASSLDEKQRSRGVVVIDESGGGHKKGRAKRRRAPGSGEKKKTAPVGRGSIGTESGNPFAHYDHGDVVDGRDHDSAGADGGNADWGWYVDNPEGGGGDGDSDGTGGRGVGGDGGVGGGKSHDLRQALETIAANKVVLMLFVASSARMIATWSMASYLAIYFHRQFPSQVSLFSVYNAVFVSIGGVASSWGGGAIADRLRVYNEGVLGYLPAVGSLGAIFPMAVVLFSPKFSVALSGLFFAYLVGECWLGPGMALLQMELPKELTGTSVAILLFLNSVVCNVGPWFITWQDDGLATVNRPLFAVLFVSFLSSFFLFSAVGFIVSRKHKRRRSILMSIEAAGILDTEGDAGKPFDGYTRQSRDGSNVVRRGKRPNLCEMVRRTFSSGTRLDTAVFQGDEEDMRVSSGLSRRESTSGVGRNGFSCAAVAEPGSGIGERDSLLRGSFPMKTSSSGRI